MNTPRTQALQRPQRLLVAATAVLALAAGLAHTARAQTPEIHSMEMALPMGGPGFGGPGFGGPAGHGMGGMPMAGGRGLQRMLDTVGASAEQRAQVQQIVDTARADLRAQHKGAQQLQDQGMALFAQPTVDARAVETLRQQRMAQHDAASKRMTQMMLDVSRVLTPEQRKTLAERMVQRRALMQRQRGERDALDGQPAGR